MQVSITHQHLPQKIYAMTRVPVCAVVLKLGHGDVVAALDCVEQDVIRVSDGVLEAVSISFQAFWLVGITKQCS